ncbi:MAG: DUF58 domain-containing protein [Polyangia bacterium]
MSDRSNGVLGTPLDAETLEAIKTLEIEVRRTVEGLQGGGHASHHVGASVEFSEHWRYAPGDDLRDIDWRAFARTDRYFVKRHEREVTLRCLLVGDCSASMGFRGTRAAVSKLRYTAVLLGAIAHVMVRQGDAVGLLLFADRVIEHLPPRRNPDHLFALLSRLATVETPAGGGTDYSAAIRRAAEGAGRRGMIVIASDLWGAGHREEVALASLASRGHDVALFHLLSPDETDLPFDREAVFSGLENEGEVEVDPSRIREDYRRELEALRERWRRVTGEAGIDLIQAETSAPPEATLARFAARRRRAGRAR